MSEQEQVKEEWYEYNGSTYHKDKYGKWWVGKTGYENLYVNGIDHSGLREDIGKMIENNQLNNKDQFQYNEEKFTFFKDDNDIYNSKISRKVKVPEQQSSEGNAEKSQMPEAIKKLAKPEQTGGNKNFPKGESGWFAYDSYDFVTLEDYKKKRETNKNIRMLRPKEMDPNNYLVKDDKGNTTVKVWIGEWIKPQDP